MTDWTEGYVADIGYTFGYYTELNPLRVKLAFLNAGLACPEIGLACELGFGQGLSANLHAAASVLKWHGTDFNPSQAGFAQELSAVSDSGAKLYDEAFDEFAQRDMPEFDYIGLHGIWSWISDENRATIVDFIRKKLKVGGVLYISYNTLPGWGSFAPMRYLLTQHAEVMGSNGSGIISRIDSAIEFAEKLIETNPIFVKSNPQAGERIKQLKTQNRHYLAHEYFNRDWHPMHFSKMAQWLEGAKLQYACSAHFLDHVDAINLTQEQQIFLREIPDAMFRENVRDFMVNQQFRRDYWVRGVRKLSVLEQAEDQRKVQVLLTAHRPDVTLKVGGSLGQADMTESIYKPILDLLGDHKIKTLGQIEAAVQSSGIAFTQIMQATLVLVGAGHVSIVQEDHIISKSRKTSDKVNAHLMNKSRGSGDVSYLSSPVTGGGVAVGRFQQLFMLAMQQGKKLPEEWAQQVWQIIQAQGQKIVKEGLTLESDEENLTELRVQAVTFAEKQLPILKALHLI